MPLISEDTIKRWRRLKKIGRNNQKSHTFQKHICTSNYDFNRNSQKKLWCWKRIIHFDGVLFSAFFFLLREVFFSFSVIPGEHILQEKWFNYSQQKSHLFLYISSCNFHWPFFSHPFFLLSLFFPFIHIHKFVWWGYKTQSQQKNTTQSRREREGGTAHFVFAEICRENKRNIKRWRNCCLFLFIKSWWTGTSK